MWIRDVDIPKQLVEAHQTNDLVLFVGAGASMGKPSSLPSFPTLAATIAGEAGVAVSEEDLAQPDVLLGNLEDDHKVDVRVRVAAHLDNSGSQPNPLHEAICALARSKPPVRIVTTNYDLHLSAVLQARAPAVPEYYAPALPMGDNFSGLVYLHGSLGQPSEDLVVTDADFGRAYLRDAWATRFLERMFSTYRVLFIGYSHSDVVMGYLARGLGPDDRRFILTDKPTASNWRRFFVRPVEYPNTDGEHKSLVEAVQGWAEWSSMGLLEHRQRVSTLVATNPSGIPEEQSYMEETVRDPERVGFFTEYARGGQWLSWASKQDEFKALFDPSSGGTDCSYPLAHWFAENYVGDASRSQGALRLTQEMGGRLGSHLQEAIGRTINATPHPLSEWVRPWLALLVLSPNPIGVHWLNYFLPKCRWPEDRDLAIFLLDHLLEPHVELGPGFGSDDAVRAEVKIRGDEFWITKAWSEVVMPNIDEAFGHLLPVVDRHLRRVDQLQALFGTLGPDWDPISFRRSAIEPHEQDHLCWPIDVLLDVARDALEAALATDPETANGYIRSWSSASSVLLKRLAVHGWTVRSDIEASQKIEFVTGSGRLFDRQLRHEIFRLIDASIVEADQEKADGLVARALEGPSDVEDEVRDYEVFNLIAWIHRSHPDLSSAAEAFEALQAEHEEFEVREHPDLLSWSSFGTRAAEPPMSNDGFHALLADSPEEAVQSILDLKDSTPPFDSPTLHDAVSLVSATVRQFPTDGLTILDTELGDDVGVMRAVVRGWSRAELNLGDAEEILGRLAGLDLSLIAEEVASLLTGATDADPESWPLLEQARVVAAQLWEAIDTDAPDDHHDIQPDASWLHTAINDPAGQVAEFWLAAVSAEWRQDQDSWERIPQALRAALETLIQGESRSSMLAQVILASRFHFIYAADQEWCLENVFPLLDWVNPEGAKPAWDGYLTWGRWTDRTLEAGLLGKYLEAADHIELFDDDLQRRLCEHLASIAVVSELDKGWIRDLTTSATPDTRTEWINQVAYLLRDLPTNAIENQWNTWMRAYWSDRLASVPTALTFEESSALARWPIYLGESLPEGVDLAVARPAGVPQNSTLLADLNDPDRIAQSPEALAQLVAHVLSGTEQPFWECPTVAEVVGLLSGLLPNEALQPIREQGLRLSCADAADW